MTQRWMAVVMAAGLVSLAACSKKNDNTAGGQASDTAGMSSPTAGTSGMSDTMGMGAGGTGAMGATGAGATGTGTMPDSTRMGTAGKTGAAGAPGGGR
jgi:hypothetical protein